MASLTSSKPSSDEQRQSLVRDLQAELKRVGCYTGDVDGNWGAGSRSGLETFVRTTGFSFKNLDPSPDAWNAVSSQRVRICPLRCASGEVDQGGKCVVARPRDPDTKATSPVDTGGARSARLSATPPGNLSAYSLTYWPRNTLSQNQTVSAGTPFGKLTCTSTGRDSPRACSLR